MEDLERSEYFDRFGTKLKQERESRGISRQAFSTMTDIDLVSIIRIECGEIDFPAVYVFAFLRALDIPPSKFFEDFD